MANELGLHSTFKVSYKESLLLPYFNMCTCIFLVITLNVQCNVTKNVEDYMKNNSNLIQKTTGSNINYSKNYQLRNSVKIILNNSDQMNSMEFSH